MTYKCLNMLASPYLCDKFEMTSKIHWANTWNRNKLDFPLHNLASEQQTFHYRAVSTWNELPNHIKNIDTLDRLNLNINVIYCKSFWKAINNFGLFGLFKGVY